MVAVNNKSKNINIKKNKNITYTKELIQNRYEVRLEFKNTNNEYVLVKYYEPLHFQFLSEAKYFCNDLKFRLDVNERYAVYDRLCDGKLIYYSEKVKNKKI